MQSSVYDVEQEVWLPRNIKCMDAEIALPNVSDLKVNHFVKSLDISHVCQIWNYPGVSRTVTGLVFMILDLYLQLPRLHKQLIWFNGNKYHFIFQFSDDRVPETSELAMSIGTLTRWNLGSRVRTREFHYLLHFLQCLREAVSNGRHQEAAQRQDEGVGRKYFDCSWSAVYTWISTKRRSVKAKLG